MNMTDGGGIQAHVKKSFQEGISDRILNLVDIGAMYNVATAVVPSVALQSPAGEGIGNLAASQPRQGDRGVLHPERFGHSGHRRNDDSAGNPTWAALGPVREEAKPVEGGRTSHLTAGDIRDQTAPFVPHGWTSVGPEGIEYIVFRVEPEHVLARRRSGRIASAPPARRNVAEKYHSGCVPIRHEEIELQEMRSRRHRHMAVPSSTSPPETAMNPKILAAVRRA